MVLGRLPLVVLSILYLVLTMKTASPESWDGFYSSQASSTRTQRMDNENICIEAILRAQKSHGIPDNLLLAIGIQEAGRQIGETLTVWPWTANANGIGAFFDNKKALDEWARKTHAAGTRSFDVGCMQVNQKWHARHFSSLTEATEPTRNVEYAAQFLKALHAETGDWWEAAGRYHSSTHTLKDAYLGKLAHNLRLVNSKSWKAGSSRSDSQMSKSTSPRPKINWSADLTGLGARQIRQVVSIYSSTPLRPIIPDYREVKE